MAMNNKAAINSLQNRIQYSEGSIKSQLDSFKDWERNRQGDAGANNAYYNGLFKFGNDRINSEKQIIAKAKADIEELKKRPDIVKENKVITGNDKLSFKKRGNVWYGYSGWDE